MTAESAPELLRDRLTPEQWQCLLAPVAADRVNMRDGNDYLEQWDVRRWLTRIFGHGGWDHEVRELTCIREHGIQQGETPRWRWWISYRAQVRLHVRDQWGRPLGFWDGSGADEKANQPGHGDAHHGAMTSAESTALKRAAINLGDAFGLSLYSSAAFDRQTGKTLPVVGWVAIRPPDKPPETAEAVPGNPAETPPIDTEQQQSAGPDGATGAAVLSANDLRAEIRSFATAQGWDLNRIASGFESDYGIPIKQAPPDKLRQFLGELHQDAQAEAGRVAS